MAMPPNSNSAGYTLPLNLVAELPTDTVDAIMANAGIIAFESAINSLWTLGTENQTEIKDQIAAIVTKLQQDLALGTTPKMAASAVSPAVVDEPLVDIPTSVTADDIYADFIAQYTLLITEFETQRTWFMGEYFPNEQALYDKAETWLSAAIDDPNGLPPAVAAQIFGDETSRIIADGARATDAVIAQFAARGFPLPPDAVTAATLQIQQKTQGLTAEAARKVAIASIEQLRWVIEKMLSLRDMALKACVDYVKSIAMGPEIAARLVPVGYDAQSKLITSVAAYYNARTNAKELNYKGYYDDSLMEQHANTKNLDAEIQTIDQWLKAVLAELQVLGQLASALFNNVNLQSSMGVSNSKTVTESA